MVKQHRYGGNPDSGHLLRYLGMRLLNQMVGLLRDAIKFLRVEARCKGKELGLVHQMEMDVKQTWKWKVCLLCSIQFYRSCMVVPL